VQSDGFLSITTCNLQLQSVMSR